MKRSATTLALVAAMLAATPGAVRAANEIGVTSAVLPNARGTPPDQATRILEVGNDMYARERVQTVENGKVHLLFLDGSAMSIGPNSDMVLDEFVYDPDNKTGNLAFSATKGVFRFVGGRISKTTPVTIKTPNATIGIRGGVALITLGAAIRATLLFGDELFIEYAGRTHRIRTPGYQIQVSADGSVSEPTVASSEDLSEPLDQLEGDESQTVETATLVADNDVANSQIGDLSSNLAPTQVGPGDAAEAAPAESVASGETVDDVAEADDSSETNLGQDNPDAGGGAGGGGGGNGGGDGNGVVGLAGMYRHANTRATGTDVDASLDEPINNGGIAASATGTTTVSSSPILYPVSQTQALTGDPGSGSYLDYDATAQTNSVFGAIVPGRSFVADSGEFSFVFADETDFDGHAVFAFIGVPTPLAAFATGGVAEYALQRDLLLDGDLPFIGTVHDGDFGIGGDVIGTALINWQAVSGARGTLFAGNSAFSGMADAQRSGSSVIVGPVLTDAAGLPFVQGQFRGSVRADATAATATTFLSSAVSTTDAFGGSDFFGTAQPNFLNLDSSQVDATDTVTGAGVSATTGVTAGTSITVPNVPATRRVDDPDDQTRTPRTLLLETGGIVQDRSAVGAAPAFRRFIGVTAGNVGNLVLGGDGTVSANASIVTIESSETATVFGLNFGGSAQTSAFVADEEFGAVESATASTIDGAAVGSQLLYFTSLAEVASNGALPANFDLCTCNFLSAGFWGGQLRTGDIAPEFHLVPWVAGAALTAADFPASGTASYAGNAVVQVYNALGATPVLYNAAGTVDAAVTFSPGNVAFDSFQMVADGATVNLIGGGATPGPFALGGGGTRGQESLSAVAQARFAGTNLSDLYGSIAAGNDARTYLQSGVFGADRQ